MKDTPDEVYKRQMAILLAQSAEQRILALSNLCDFMRGLALRRIDKLHPDFTRKQIMDEYIKQQFPEKCKKMKIAF